MNVVRIALRDSSDRGTFRPEFERSTMVMYMKNSYSMRMMVSAELSGGFKTVRMGSIRDWNTDMGFFPKLYTELLVRRI